MRILFYGDSNTWGYDAKNECRYHKPYPTLIQESLKGDTIINASLCGRTLCHEDPYDSDRNGLRHLSMTIKMHLPLDRLAIALGINDCKRIFSTNIYNLEKGLRALLDVALNPAIYTKGMKQPEIWVLSPFVMNKDYHAVKKTLANFGQEGYEMSLKASEVYKGVCEMYGVHFFDTSSICTASAFDGLHIDEEGHKKIAQALVKEWSR